VEISNLRLIDEPVATLIESDGFTWDLHNNADFVGLCQNIVERKVILSWQIVTMDTVPSPPADGFDLVFSDTEYLEVTPRDSEIPDFLEDRCINDISRVHPNDSMDELIHHGVPQIPDFNESGFHLLFEFRGGQRVRIGARSVQLRMHDRAKAPYDFSP